MCVFVCTAVVRARARVCVSLHVFACTFVCVKGMGRGLFHSVTTVLSP